MFVPAAEANILNITIGTRIQPLENNILERVFAMAYANQAIVDAYPVTLKGGGAAKANPCDVDNSFSIDLNSESAIPVTPQYDCVVRTAISFIMVALASHILPENQCNIIAGECFKGYTTPTRFPKFQILSPGALKWRHGEKLGRHVYSSKQQSSNQYAKVGIGWVM